MGDQRSNEGHMDWEYNGQGPVDTTSPFVHASQRAKMASFASSPSKYGGLGPNPFAAARPESPFKTRPQPPQASMFSPSMPKAPPFRNNGFAFMTPQKRVEELASEYSGAESSPAMTDNSEMPIDSPDPADRTDDDMAKMTITPATRKNIFANASPAKSVSYHTSGRGDVLSRPKDSRQRENRIRKRRRQYEDKDVGSVRSRGLNHESDESDSDYEGDDRSRRSSRSGKGKRRRPQGWFGGFLTTIHDHPNAPVILSWWIQFGINLFFAGMGALVFLALGSMVMSDFRYAAAEARSKLLGEMAVCTKAFVDNRCAPKSDRLPALAEACDAWELCMSQDPEKIKSLAIQSKQMAITINEFFNVLSFKAWGFILSLIIVFLLANNVGFTKFRQSMNAEVNAPHAAPSQPAIAPTPHHPQLFPHSQNPNQAFIFAPVTPRNLRRGLFLNDEATDTDESPSSEVKSIMPAPATSGRRSPSKGDRIGSSSPSKNRSSPSKFR